VPVALRQASKERLWEEALLSSKRTSKTATAAVIALLASPGLAQADCVEELNKLKAAAATYKRIRHRTGDDDKPLFAKKVFPDKIRELVHFSVLGVGFNFDKQACMKKKLTYRVSNCAQDSKML
jgi:hypothetical protein